MARSGMKQSKWGGKQRTENKQARKLERQRRKQGRRHAGTNSA